MNQDTNVEVVRFDLAEDYSTETAMVFGEVYRHNGEWKFKAVVRVIRVGLLPCANNTVFRLAKIFI